MPRCLIAFAALLIACGPSEPPADSPSVETPGRTERFEVPILDRLLYAEIRATEVAAPADPGAAPLVRAEIRLCREDGTDAGVVRDDDGTSPSWTGVVPGEELEIQFYNLMIEPGVPAPLNVVQLFVKASVDDGSRVDFDLRSIAICVR